MKINSLAIPEVKLIELEKYEDDRGFLMETFRQDKFNPVIGTDVQFVQDNLSFSKSKYTVRGLHLQADPHAQGKLVSCSIGKILDVVVDVRKNSNTFGRSAQAILSAENACQLWVPPGFLHGFVTLQPDTQVRYKCTNYYAPDHAKHVMWNDPELGIDWGFDHTLVTLSEKDMNAKKFSDFAREF